MSNVLPFSSRLLRATIPGSLGYRDNPVRVAGLTGTSLVNIRLDLLLADETGQLALRSAGLSEPQFRRFFHRTAQAHRRMLDAPKPL